MVSFWIGFEEEKEAKKKQTGLKKPISWATFRKDTGKIRNEHEGTTGKHIPSSLSVGVWQHSDALLLVPDGTWFDHLPNPAGNPYSSGPQKQGEKPCLAG